MVAPAAMMHAMDEARNTALAVPDRPRLRKVVVHSVFAGLTPAIPIPFVDDFFTDQVREAMVRDVLRGGGIEPSPVVVRILSGADDSKGRLFGFIRGLVLYPIKKIFRKVFFVLALKDCVDVASRALHEGFLLQHALLRGDLTGAPTDEQARRVRGAIAAACRRVDPRPVNQLLRRIFAGSRALLAEGVRALTAWLRPKGGATPGPAAPAEGEGVKSLVDRVTASLWEEQGYLQTLSARYDEALAPP